MQNESRHVHWADERYGSISVLMTRHTEREGANRSTCKSRVRFQLTLSCYALLQISRGYMPSLFTERSSSVWIEDVSVV